MKKSLLLFALAAFAASSSFATYVVMLKDGARYVAKAKWTIVKGKAIVQLENGQALQLDPSLIDVPRSEQATKLGLTNANVIDLNTNMPETQPVAPARPSLGSSIKLRKPQQETAPPPVQSSKPPIATTPGSMPPDVIDRFERAFENVGIFEKKVVSTGGNTLRADLTADTEERVFNAISATSFLMVRNAGQSVRIDLVELYMRTTTGGVAGRFQMTRADALALDQHTISQQEYFVRKVIY
jgi:hypothetical protein